MGCPVVVGGRHGPGKEGDCAIVSFPSSLTTDIRGPFFSFFELWGEVPRRMEMWLLLGNKGLWSCPCPSRQASESGLGLCWWSWVLLASLGSSKLSQIPAALWMGH